MAQRETKFNWRNLSLLIAVSFVAVYLYQSFVLDKGSKKLEDSMYMEMAKIKPPNDSKRLKTESYHKSDNALVFSDYSSDLNDDEIVSHYRNVLQENGWSHCCNDDDQINKEMVFQKDDITAHLYLKKSRLKGSKAYRVSVAWGLFDCSRCR